MAALSTQVPGEVYCTAQFLSLGLCHEPLNGFAVEEAATFEVVSYTL